MLAPLAWSIFVRSLLVQASWNFKGMQNLGYFLMCQPALARRRLAPPERAQTALVQLRLFNTHPYFSGLVAATVMREEQDGADGEQTEGLKRSLMCILGSVGDEFFWATLRPLAAIAALPAAMAGWAWAPLVLFGLYNVPHLGVRAWGILAGLSRGRGIVEALQRRPLSRAIPALAAATTTLSGFIVGVSAADRSWGLVPGAGAYAIAASLAVFAALATLQVRGCSQGRLLAMLSAAATVAAAYRVVLAP